MAKRKNGQGQLVKRGNSWNLVLRVGASRKWYGLATPVKAEAVIKAKLLLERLKEEPSEPAKAKVFGLSWQEVWRRFEEKERCCELNMKSYATTWRRFLDALTPYDVDITLQLRPMHIEAYVNALERCRLRGRKLSSWTLRRRVNDVKRILSVGGVDTSFFKSIELPEAIEGRGREPFTDEELEAIQKVFRDERVKCPHKDEMEAAHLIGLHTGLRLKDVCFLKWTSVDFAKGVVSLTPHKTKRFCRTISIPIGKTLEEVLRKAEMWQDENRGFVLPGLANRYSSNRTGIPQDYRDILIAAGIKTTTLNGECKALVTKGFHSLRHTFISRLAERGISPLIIQSMSGQESFWDND